MKRVIFALLVITIVTSASGELVESAQAKYSGGTGDPCTPYQIANVADLLTLAADANDYNKCFILTADIDLDPNLPGNQIFTTAVIARGRVDPTGYNLIGNAFTGVFDGAGRKIINLTIDANVNSNDFLGFFGDINGGEVKNLGLEDVKIISSGNFSYFCGTLAGRLENGVISNCYSSGNVTTGAVSWLVGGLVGENGHSGSISNSHSTCNVTGADNSSELGGLAGRNLGTINNCFSKGTVASDETVYGIGGLAGYNGYNGGYIINSFSTSTISGGNDSFSLGGLAGCSDGVITDCFSTGSVAGGYSIAELGGLVGMVGYGSISNCYSTGTVTGGDWAFCLGGFAGALGEMSEPNISNCYSTGDVNGGNSSSSLGGFIGQCQGDISNCYSTGNVNRTSGEFEMGGFAGSINFGGDIIGSYYLDTAGPDNGLGTPLSDTQMKQQASFVGWDFVWETINGTEDIWAICEGVTYPKLAWQFVVGDSDDDKDVDFIDFAVMGNKWLQADSNLYCGGTDLTGDGLVNLEDLAALAENWLDAQ